MNNAIRRPATVAVSAIVPGPFARPHLEDGAFAELVRSIERTNGPIQRPVVRDRGGGKYELVCGHRRWRAAKKAGQKQIAVDVAPVGDAEAATWMLTENIGREDLDPVTKAMLLWRVANILQEAGDGVGGHPPTLTERKAGRLLEKHVGLSDDTIRKMLAVLPSDPRLRAALQRAAPHFELIRLAQVIARLGRQRPGQTHDWMAQIAINAAKHKWTVADLRGARDRIKATMDLEEAKGLIKALAAGDRHPRTLHEFRDLSAGFLLPFVCPRCEFEFGPLMTPGGATATVAAVERLLQRVQRAVAVYKVGAPPDAPTQVTAHAWGLLRRVLKLLTPTAPALGRGREGREKRHWTRRADTP